MIDPTHRDQVVLEASAEVEFGKLDILTQDMVNLADIMAVGANDFHVFSDLRGGDHFNSPYVQTDFLQTTQRGLLVQGSLAARRC
jgi:hypothetical protein